MSKMDLPMAGSCRCGQVRIEVSAPPLVTMACHCRTCQKMSSSAFSVSMAVPAEGFRVIAGDTVAGGPQGETEHAFCPNCLSWMFTRSAGPEDTVNVRTAMLDAPDGFAPFIETCTTERLPWAGTSAVYAYRGFPPPADMARLLGEYAVRAG